MSSRRRLVLSIVTSVLVVLLTFGTAAVFVVRAQLLDRIDEEMSGSSKTVGTIITPELLDEITANPNFGSSNSATILIDDAGERTVEIPAVTTDGVVPLPDIANFTADDLRARAGQPFTRQAIGDSSIDYRVLVTPIGADGELLISARTLTDVRETLGVLVIILLGSYAAAAVVLAVLIWLFSRATIKPIDDMIEVAGTIGEGDLGARVKQDSNNAEVARLAVALNSMLGQLEVAFADKESSEARLRRFAADASHELRTPLTTIQGWADLYHAGGRDDPAMTDQAMDRISREAARMSTLVEDLLLLARLDQQRPLAAGRVDLAKVVGDSTADLHVVSPNRPMTVEMPGSPVLIIGDEARIRQVVANLLSNIAVHTDPDVAARITLTSDHDIATLTISDRGPGLAETDADRVFDRFYRAEDSRSRLTGGSGLGLAIVQSVVETHGGSVVLTTSPGNGATFTITLPLAAEPVPARVGSPISAARPKRDEQQELRSEPIGRVSDE